jgi:hypothetical protein
MNLLINPISYLHNFAHPCINICIKYLHPQYDTTINPARNIGLPDSLLSRFDFLFLVLDNKDPDVDRAIANHVVRMHRYRKANADSASSCLDVGTLPSLSISSVYAHLIDIFHHLFSYQTSVWRLKMRTAPKSKLNSKATMAMILICILQQSFRNAIDCSMQVCIQNQPSAFIFV